MPVTQLEAPEAAAEADPPAPVEETPKRRRRLGRLGRRGVIVLVVALVLLLGGAGYGVWALFFAGKSPTTQYRTVTVTKETLKSTVSATGTLQPAKESALSFSSSGEVSSVKVAVGDKVSKGDVLARINDDELKIDLDAAQAELTEAEDSLSTLEDDSSATDTAIASAKANVQVQKNAVKQAQSALDDADLVAPFSGTVAAVGIQKGDTVGSSSSGSGTSSGGSGSAGSNNSGSGSNSSGSNSSSSSSESITLISTGTFVVDTSVSNVDLPSIKKGLQATITPTGSTDPVFGTVSTVGVVASSSSSSSGSNSGSATFPVTIAVTGKHSELLPGSSATVDITVKQLANVISVPTQAISTVNGKTVVQKLVNGQQVPTEVSIGQVVGTSTVITKGLNDGDQVVVFSFTAAAGTRSGSSNQNQGFPGGGNFPGGGQGGFPGGSGQGGTRQFGGQGGQGGQGTQAGGQGNR